MESQTEDELVKKLIEINELLSSHEGWLYSSYYRLWFAAALSGEPEALERFLVSNELWGGSGSLCDSALLDAPLSVRREFQRLIVELAELQLSIGLKNPRTELWSSAYKSWST